MRIKQISVTNLFGIFDHTIFLNMDERITIIHGPNGFGKTAILRILNGIFQSNYSEIHSIPFDNFKVDFDEGSKLIVTKNISEEPTKAKKNELIFEFNKPGEKPQIFKATEIKRLQEIEIDWEDIEDIEDENSIVINYTTQAVAVYNRILREKLSTHQKEPEWWLKIINCLNVRLIEAQRLLLNSSNGKTISVGETRQKMILSVSKYSADLAEEIQTKLAEYGELSQSLDRTFPARVVNQREPSNLTEEALRNQLIELEKKRTQIIEAGLLDRDKNSDFQVNQKIMDERTKSILSLYVEDANKKLGVFEELTKKIEVFKRIIQNKFLYKQMTISKDKGFTFTAADGNLLSPTDLSSGEQHELVLLYELLFKTKPGSLILIDEPELSLHVAWQVQFLKDLQEITQLANFDVVIATHSPDIISDRWDLTVELKGPVE